MAFGITTFAESPFAATGSQSINVQVTGQELTVVETSPGVIGDANVSLTGQTLNTTLNNDGINIFVGVKQIPVGIGFNANLGSVTTVGDANVLLTGQELNAAEGTAVLDANTFAVVSGEAMTAEEGIVDPSPDASVTGIGMTATIGVGTVVVGTANIDVTGELLTAGIGSLTVTADANTNISGELLSIAQGSVFAFTDVDVAVTGQELTMQENAPTVIGDANVTLTENALTANLGTAVLDANTLVDLTGQAMTMQEGTATADDASAEITGLSLSMSLGTVKNIMWSEVNTGITQPWTEVDTAA